MDKSVYKDIKLVQPPFESLLTDLVIELEHLRKKRLEGNTHRQVVQNSDIREVLEGRHITSISRDLKGLKSRKIILSEAENTRKYHINLTNNFLMRSVINTLKNEGFIPIKPFSTLYR